MSDTLRVACFEIRPGTHPGPDHARDRDVQRVVDTLAACRFPWYRVIAQLQRNTRTERFPFPIEWNDKPEGGYLGYVSNRRMWLTVNVNVQTIAHELAHVADLGTLGERRGRPTWNTTLSPARRKLLDLADHHDRRDHPHGWHASSLQNIPWEQLPVEAVTVPWTRAYFNDRRFHYPERRFTRDGHTWPDVDAVKAVFEEVDLMPFTDVDDSPHRDAILWAYEHGLVSGHDDGTFRPSDTISRGQIASILYAYHRGVA